MKRAGVMASIEAVGRTTIRTVSLILYWTSTVFNFVGGLTLGAHKIMESWIKPAPLPPREPPTGLPGPSGQQRETALKLKDVPPTMVAPENDKKGQGGTQP